MGPRSDHAVRGDKVFLKCKNPPEGGGGAGMAGRLQLAGEGFGEDGGFTEVKRHRPEGRSCANDPAR
jgi:hypothetical protein